MEWVKCSERLPEDEQSVIVYGITERWIENNPSYLPIIVGAKFFKKYGFRLYSDEGKIIDIKHWIALPELPEEG